MKKPAKLRLDQFRNARGVVKKSCDFNPEDPDDVALPNDTEEEIRQRILAHHIAEAKRHAEKISDQLEFAERSEITEDLIQEIQRTGMVWLKLAKILSKQKYTRSNYEEEINNHALR